MGPAVACCMVLVKPSPYPMLSSHQCVPKICIKKILCINQSKLNSFIIEHPEASQWCTWNFLKILKFAFISHLNPVQMIYSGVRQNDWETRPPPGNYSSASDTWIQVSTNKMPAPDYAWWRSNNSHCDVIMSRLWLWWSWRPHNLRFRKARCISSLAAWCGRPRIGP